jgi:uncharacterized membrane protein YfcA
MLPLVSPDLSAVAIVLVGLASGVLSGMFGVGGAVLTTPGIRVFGATPIEAVGSTIPAILPSAISGTIRYAKAGLVDWRIGLVCGSTGALLAFVGAWVADLVDGHLLMVLTAVLLGWSGWSLYRSAAALPAEPPSGESVGTSAEQSAEDPDPRTDAPTATALATPPLVAIPTLAVIGCASGFVAGLLGVGGGVVMMPVFTKVLRLPIKTAVASSLVAVAIFSVPALLTHAALGHINWYYALLLVVGVIPGAQIGSHITVGSSDRKVRIMAGLFFMALAVVYGGGELLALT